MRFEFKYILLWKKHIQLYNSDFHNSSSVPLRMIFVVASVVLLLGAQFTNGELTCTRTVNEEWKYIEETLHTCIIEDQSIDNPNSVVNSYETSFQGLSIRKNKDVEFIPAEIGENFPSMRGLKFFGCSIKSVTEKSLQNLTKLVIFGINQNEVDHVECKAFRNLQSLEYLRMGSNKIEVLCSTVFVSLVKLKRLLLSDNVIEFLSENIFNSLNALENLDLSGNRIYFLHENLFHGLINLKKLTLYSNHLKEITKSLFMQNLKLEDISFDNNTITYLKFDIFDGLTSLKNVTLLNNTCIDQSYTSDQLTAMKDDLKANCTVTEFNNCQSIATVKHKKSIFNHRVFRVFFGHWTFK